jgi:hypothetical protein
MIVKKVLFLTFLALLLVASGTAFAQGDNTVYFVTYFSNNASGVPDATVRFVNDGDTGGSLWAAFYVFDDSQELTECCACVITPDGVLSESVQKNLTANPLTSHVPKTGVIKVISSASNDPTNTKPTAGLRGWATHIQKGNGTAYWGSETKFADANLAGAEQSLLQNLCYYDAALSGNPCTCTPEDTNF